MGSNPTASSVNKETQPNAGSLCLSQRRGRGSRTELQELEFKAVSVRSSDNLAAKREPRGSNPTVSPERGKDTLGETTTGGDLPL